MASLKSAAYGIWLCLVIVVCPSNSNSPPLPFRPTGLPPLPPGVTLRPFTITPPHKVSPTSGASSIAAPSKILPNNDYSVAVHIYNTNTSSNVTLEVDCSGSKYFTSEVFKVDGSKFITLKIGDVNGSECSLKMTGTGGVNFDHQATLHPPSQVHQMFIQTDKPMYKPGDTVKFRSTYVNQNLKPVLNKTIEFLIKDPEGNIMKKITETPSTKLILSNEFSLSDQPVLGDWTIEAKADSKSYSKRFTVAEYVLPSFSVEITSPKGIDASQEKIIIPIKATYTYGKPVSGQIKVTVEKENTFPSTASPVVVHSEIDGQKDFEFVTKELLGESLSEDFRVTAEVTDKLSGKVYNASTTFKIHEDAFKVEMIPKLEKYISGMEYPLHLKILRQDDTPVEDKNVSIQVSYSVQGKDRNTTGILSNGVARFVLNTTFDGLNVHQSTPRPYHYHYHYPYHYHDNSMKVHVYYKGKQYFVKSIQKADFGKCALQVYDTNEYTTTEYKAGQTIKLNIDSNQNISELFYIVSTKNGVKHNKEVFESNNKHLLNLAIDSDMAPKCQILVYARCNDTIGAASIKVNVDYEYQNSVKISSSQDIVKPGSPVNLIVNTTGKATVALLGMDQQMLLLKTGNDINNNEVEELLEKTIGCNSEKSLASCVRQGAYWRQSNVWEESGVHYFRTGIEDTNRYPWALPGVNTPVYMLQSAPTSTSRRPLPLPTRPMPYPGPPPFTKKRRDAQPIRLRKDFPETWLWETLDADESGKLEITRKAPDTITSWIVSAISLSKDKGLAISEKSKIKVFRPFFVKLNLPYSVIRGETVSINATVYNYFNEPQAVVVTIMNDNQQLEIPKDINDPNEIETAKSPLTKTVTVPADGGVTVSFVVKPKILGHVDINVKAESSIAGDQILKKLLVKPEGETRYFNKPMLITGGDFKEEVNIELPADIVPDSKRITASVVGDILGNSFNNLDDLVRMPYGCGEQNMVNFVPNILVLDYLTKINKLKPEMKAKALSHIEKGYQKELTYKHDDGSYSAFGKSDGNGSTWLTAFVLRSFLQAKKHLEIDENVLREAKRFLIQQQQADGSFVDHGRMLSKTMQGLSTKGAAALTAYVLSAIALEPDSDKDSIVSKSQIYLTNYLVNTTDAYEVSIITYALTLTNADSASTAIDKLASVAIKKSGFTHWEQVGGSQEASIETTAYALMSYILANRTSEAASIVRYLVSKQNSNGGFVSTQDTVVGLQALAAFASSLSGVDTNMNVNIIGNKNDNYTINVDEETKMVLHKVLISPNTTSVNLHASGIGSCVVQVSWQCNVIKRPASSSFDIQHSQLKKKADGSFQLVVETRYLEKGESGMAIVEVSLPSGYVADEESFDDIKKSGAKRVETKDSATIIVVYLDQVSSQSISFPITAVKVADVSNLKPSLITVYDYYDKSKSGSTFYSI